MRPAEVTVRAPGKVNLYLAVGALDDDGFHEVRTVLQAVSLYDELTAAPAEAGTRRAHHRRRRRQDARRRREQPRRPRRPAARRKAGVTDGVRMALRKSIPVAAGMAGGQRRRRGRAGRVRRALGHRAEPPRARGAGRRARQRRPVLAGRRYGAGHRTRRGPVAGALARDLPLGLRHRRRRALHARRLRRTRPLPRGAAASGALVALRHARRRGPRRSRARWRQPSRTTCRRPAIRLRPALRRVLDAGTELGAVGALVSGSGPTCAFLARDAERGRAAGSGTRRRRASAGWCAAPTARCPGARVVS